MSIQTFSSQAPPTKSKRTRAWIALSLILSMSMIAWAFAIPARREAAAQAEAAQRAKKAPALQLSNSTLILTGTPEEVRDSALAADEEFLRAIARRESPGQGSLRIEESGIEESGIEESGIEATRVKWQQKAERVQREEARFRNAPEGSIEWAFRKEQLDSLKDGPPQ